MAGSSRVEEKKVIVEKKEAKLLTNLIDAIESLDALNTSRVDRDPRREGKDSTDKISLAKIRQKLNPSVNLLSDSSDANLNNNVELEPNEVVDFWDAYHQYKGKPEALPTGDENNEARAKFTATDEAFSKTKCYKAMLRGFQIHTSETLEKTNKVLKDNLAKRPPYEINNPWVNSAYNAFNFFAASATGATGGYLFATQVPGVLPVVTSALTTLAQGLGVVATPAMLHFMAILLLVGLGVGAALLIQHTLQEYAMTAAMPIPAAIKM